MDPVGAIQPNLWAALLQSGPYNFGASAQERDTAKHSNLYQSRTGRIGRVFPVDSGFGAVKLRSLRAHAAGRNPHAAGLLLVQDRSHWGAGCRPC